jgi:phage terminase Nu1 subunit (DNA packaging protein)
VLRRSLGKGSGANSWQFDSAAVVEWLRGETLATAAPNVNMAEARRRRAVAEASLAELELAKAHGQFVATRDVELVWGRIFGNVRAHLLSLPSKLVPQLTGITDSAQVYRMLTDAIREALTELSGDASIAGMAGEVEGVLAIEHEGNGADR